MMPRLMVILSAAALLILGLVMVYSASSITSFVEQGDSTGEGIKQILFAVVGIALCVGIVVFVREDMMRGVGGFVFWGLCVLLLLATAVMGTVGLGAKRWLVVGGVGIQGSEFAKIAFTIMAVKVICDFNEGTIDSRGLCWRLVLFVFVPMIFLLLLAQSDLGTTMICFVAIVAVLWLSGAPTKVVAAIIGAAILLGVIAIMAKGYRADRFSVFDPWADPQGAGYQLIHSFKALASGGLFGVGIGNSYEKLLYLPEAETDFIFAILGEELGLVGTVGVVVLFLVFMRGGLLVAQQAKSSFGLMLAGSLTTMLVFQAFLNIACVVGLLPTTGKPLPFISSGGSSLISSLMIVGIILVVSFGSNESGEYRQRRESLHVVTPYAHTGRPSREELGRRMTPSPAPSRVSTTSLSSTRGHIDVSTGAPPMTSAVISRYQPTSRSRFSDRGTLSEQRRR